jgi:hypothetical protein
MYSMSAAPKSFQLELSVNGHKIRTVLIGRHYLKKHGNYMTDELILDLVSSLDGGIFPADSITDGTEYFVADVESGDSSKIYRLVWIFEGSQLEILGVVNAYRRKSKRS